MSKYIIDKNGKVSFPHGANTFIVVQPADVEKLIANGKLSKAEVAKIRTNRVKHAKKVFATNVPKTDPETPMECPADNPAPTPSPDTEPLPLPSTEQKQE